MLQHLVNSPALQKTLLLLLPAAIWAALLVSRRYSAREYAGSFLAYVWHFQASLLLNIVLLRSGVWQFSSANPLFFGVPIDLIMGQGILLGAVNTLLLGRLGFAVRFAVAVLGLVLIYSQSAMVVAQSSPWSALAMLTALAAVPSLKLAEWTTEDRRVVARSALQSANWVCLLLWLFPSAVFQNTGDSWHPFLDRPAWANALYLMPLVIPTGLIVSALRQFAIEGDGTAFPYDPPKRLVTRGVYAYLSNPMQVGICLSMAWWGVVIESLPVSISAGVAVFLFVVFKDICNGSCAIGEQDPNWAIYQKEVPRWIPRTRAWIPPSARTPRSIGT
jgi:protein-S-isoprenylcysteine O-methyltransferase Ste14